MTDETAETTGTLEPVENPGPAELIAAVRKRDFKTVEELLERGLDPNGENEHGENAVMYAVASGYGTSRTQEALEMTSLLVNWGADPYRRGGNGVNAFKILEIYYYNYGPWRDLAAFRDVQVVLSESSKRHGQFMTARKVAADAAAAAALAAVKAEQDKKIAEMQERLHSKPSVKIKPGRQVKPGGP